MGVKPTLQGYFALSHSRQGSLLLSLPGQFRQIPRFFLSLQIKREKGGKTKQNRTKLSLELVRRRTSSQGPPGCSFFVASPAWTDRDAALESKRDKHQKSQTLALLCRKLVPRHNPFPFCFPKRKKGRTVSICRQVKLHTLHGAFRRN